MAQTNFLLLRICHLTHSQGIVLTRSASENPSFHWFGYLGATFQKSGPCSRSIRCKVLNYYCHSLDYRISSHHNRGTLTNLPHIHSHPPWQGFEESIEFVCHGVEDTRDGLRIGPSCLLAYHASSYKYQRRPSACSLSSNGTSASAISLSPSVKRAWIPRAIESMLRSSRAV